MLSIIIPIYNADKYLPRTLESVLGQTLQDWECILINDGSTDDSLSICKAYSEKDKRFRIASQDNAGVSAARNMGLELAAGEHIAFLDADDIINPVMYEQLILALNTYGVEVASCGIVHEKMPDFIENQEIAFELLNKPLEYMYDEDRSVCILVNKVFCKSVLADLRFDELICYSEDQLFVTRILAKLETIASTQAVFYHYIDHEHSSSKKQGSYELWEGYVRATEIMLEQLRISQCSQMVLELGFVRFGRAIFSLLRLAIQKRDRNSYEKYKQQYKTVIETLLKSKELSLGSWFTYWTYSQGYTLASIIHYHLK